MNRGWVLCKVVLHPSSRQREINAGPVDITRAASYRPCALVIKALPRLLRQVGTSTLPFSNFRSVLHAPCYCSCRRGRKLLGQVRVVVTHLTLHKGKERRRKRKKKAAQNPSTGPASGPTVRWGRAARQVCTVSSQPSGFSAAVPACTRTHTCRLSHHLQRPKD